MPESRRSMTHVRIQGTEGSKSPLAQYQRHENQQWPERKNHRSYPQTKAGRAVKHENPWDWRGVLKPKWRDLTPWYARQRPTWKDAVNYGNIIAHVGGVWNGGLS